MSDLMLGPLELTAPIGRGGMGTVWKGRWLPLEMPVAVKVIHSRDPLILRSFNNEIRAVAGLQHPNIVTVYHQGRIPAEVAARSDGRLPTGALYLVMELVEGGSIRSRCGRLRWPAIRTVLLALLSALAHAHARGVIHRDIKPGNVLIGPRSTIGRVRLTDFGLARAIHETDADILGTMGTPRYMAPEQSDRRWWELGPWTDLYALGRVAQALICGVPGWFGDCEAVWTPLPDDLQPWLARMMAPEPADRFQCAADAAFALQSLRDPPPSHGALPQGPLPAAADITQPLEDDAKTWDDAVGEPPMAPTAWMCPRIPPPFPVDWRPGEPIVRPLPVLGLSLFGLRTPPMLDREEERDALWRLLESAAQGERRLAVVSGGPGAGKSRLISWLVERAESTGAASGLIIQHFESDNAAMERALAHALGVSGMSREATAARLEILLRQHGLSSAYERDALLEVLAPSGALRFDSPGERYAVILRILRLLSLQRPLILWLEDAQWGGDALGLVQHILAARSGLPILIVLTWTDMPDRPLETALIQTLQPDATLDLPPFSAEASRTLTLDILRLSPALAERLSAHIGGNPMLAIQIATDWVERGLLTAGPDGLTASSPPPLPADLRGLWQRRVDALLAGRSSSDAWALELAAVLGEPVAASEWAACCRVEGVTPGPDLLGTLLDRGLARQSRGEGWRFSHWLLREALERHALSRGRLQQHHRACAGVLARREDPGADLRAAHHMLAAGDDEAALAPLLTAAQRFAVTGAHRQGLITLHTRQSALDRLGLSDTHPERLEGGIIDSYFAQMIGNLDEAVALAERTAEAGIGELRIRGLQQLARLRRDQGQLEEASRLIDQAAAETDSPILLAHCRRDRAALHLMRGDLDEAAREYTAALEGYLGCDAERELALCHKGLSRLRLKQGRFEDAVHHIEAARALHVRLGGRLGLAGCINARGEIHRAQGELDEAERCYRAALDNLRDTALSAEVITEINLALVLIARGRLAEADTMLCSGLAYFSRSGQRWMPALLMAYRLPGLVAAGRWAEAAECAEQAIRLADETSVRDADAATLAQRARDGAAAAGQDALAARLTELIGRHC